MTEEYTVYFNAFASVSYEIEAASPAEALNIAWEKASLSDCDATDWDYSEISVRTPDGEYKTEKQVLEELPTEH